MDRWDDRRRPDYAARDGYRSHNDDYRSYHDRDSGRPRYGRDNYYNNGRRDRSVSPLRYNDDSSSRRRSISPEPRGRRYSPDHGSAPSNELKLTGLPKDNAYAISEDQIREQIEGMCQTAISSVRIIIDHATGHPRGFGFVTFPTVETAIQFLEKNSSRIILYGETVSDKHYVDVAYAMNKHANQTEPNWICPECGMSNRATRDKCFREYCNVRREDAIAAARQDEAQQAADSANSSVAFGQPGESDRAPDGAASQFLLVLRLNARVTTDVLAKGISKLYAADEDGSEPSAPPTKPSNSSRNATSDGAAGARLGSIKRAFLVRDKRTHESRRYGFIEFHNVTDATAALNRFNVEERFTIASCEVDIAHPHNGIFKPAMGPSKYAVELANPGLNMEYWQSSSYAEELWVNKEPPVTDDIAKEEQSTQQGGKDNSKQNSQVKKLTKKRKAEDIEPIRETAEDRNSSMKSMFSTWNKAKETLNNPTMTKASQQSFLDTDPDQLRCLLCWTKLKSLDKLMAHPESATHKGSLLDPAKVKKGYERLLKYKLIDRIPDDWDSEAGAPASNQPYKDRAKLRRNEIRQEKEEAKAGQKISFSLGPQGSADAKADDEEESAGDTKGLDMLRKMGYSGSGGLGADGSGNASAIAVSMYASGVGLGAEGSKLGDAVEEAGKNTREDRTYSDKVKDKAKERFSRM